MSMTAGRRVGLAVLAAVVIAVLPACSSQNGVAPAPTTARVPASLNNVSVTEVLDAIAKADLPAANPRDVTASKCPKLRCLQAVDTDTVSVLKFPATGPAEIYAGETSDTYHVEDVVVVFTPAVTADQKSAYEQVVKNAIVGR